MLGTAILFFLVFSHCLWIYVSFSYEVGFSSRSLAWIMEPMGRCLSHYLGTHTTRDLFVCEGAFSVHVDMWKLCWVDVGVRTVRAQAVACG
ncbi:hypothetical protein SODALDRAFT_119422 [Sodiomyces alkalinus F11]|uniref:Uncharacterized protein n=1 Tax=Sodiomyces alkalinus (strain CBS 110278 / VKM F-3762 / F11) TaxID=1314773 RepID=A0A3N2Q441_SODAK|nr:hypothetical protein SODALDRAFT_119422 [Sodiomyces alkalinus F11]ROT41438.1 hypothetical protein SODALDRAFT_119422 [Sodiomyces alkalinus F11]